MQGQGTEEHVCICILSPGQAAFPNAVQRVISTTRFYLLISICSSYLPVDLPRQPGNGDAGGEQRFLTGTGVVEDSGHQRVPGEIEVGDILPSRQHKAA